ncbi:DMT family transporter [Rhizobium sp. CC-YZS058]|uniref:DMT family transporter n=1 Tax=Rhizobium sp. CC-YZS058 TaxID=3042153 RepID=UPI002B05A72F|nr:DMT family transporter [Rhizobium sp. CC-YZS058]MEA3536295.1 DMT family transporter [Rhizobium sp. CC-YZS058]
MQPRDLASYLFLALAWGLSFLVILHVVDGFGWVGAVSLRALIAGSALLLFARLTGRRLRFTARFWPLALVGATTVAGQLIGLSYGTPLIGTAMAAIIVAAIPLFSMIIAQLWGLERMTPSRLLGLALGMGGIVLLVGFPAVPVTASFILGCVACLAGCFCAALGSNVVSARLAGVDALEVTSAAFLIGGLMTLPLLLIIPVPGWPRPLDWAALFTSALVMSALTYVLYFKLVASIGATRSISVEFAVTIVAVFVGAVVLGEPLTGMQLAGAAIIVLGCLLVLDLLPGMRARKRRA